MAGQRKEYKAGRDRNSAHSVWGFLETALPIQSKDLVDGITCDRLVCFSDLLAFTPISDSVFLFLKSVRIMLHKSIPQKSGTRKDCPLSPYLFNILIRTLRQLKKFKRRV